MVNLTKNIAIVVDLFFSILAALSSSREAAVLYKLAGFALVVAFVCVLIELFSNQKKRRRK